MLRSICIYFILVCILMVALDGGIVRAYVQSSSIQSEIIRDSATHVVLSEVGLQTTSNLHQYFPLLMNSVSGWTSVIYVVYIGTGTKIVTIKFYDSAGAITRTDSLVVGSMWLNKFPLDKFSRLPLGSSGSAVVVDAGVNIIAHTNLKQEGELANYSALGDQGVSDQYYSAGTAPVIYAPSFKNQYSGRNSKAYIQNTSDININITVSGWDEVGGSTVSVLALPKRSTVAISGNTYCGMSHICSLKVQSNDNTTLLAGVILEENASTGFERAANEMFSNNVPNSDVILPIVKYQYGGQPMSSGFRIQNIGNNNVTPKLSFSNGNTGSMCIVTAAAPIAPGRAVTMAIDSTCGYPANTYGTGLAETVEGFHTISVHANEASVSGTSKKKAYSAPFIDGGSPIGNFSTTLYAPLVYNATISGLYWVSGISVYCLGTVDQLDIYYYQANGTALNPVTIFPQSNPIVLTPPSNFEGSIKIQGDSVPGISCSGVVNTTNAMPNQETHGLYTMTNR